MNPVLREGNSDRRAAVAVKNYAMSNPHSMGEWVPDSKTVVSTMSSDDFFSNEKSVTLTAEQAGAARIELVAQDGSITVLKESVSYIAGTVVDATFMSGRALDLFLADQIEQTKAAGVLFSIHLKATMMIEYTNVEERTVALSKLIGVERSVYFQVGNHDKVFAICNEDMDRETDVKTSAVIFMRFEFDQGMVVEFAS